MTPSKTHLWPAIALLLPVAAIAATPDEGALDEVVVTAQKRTANLQDVPFSVAATSEEQMRAAGAGNIVDLARSVASLAIADLGPGQSQVAIRGVSSGQECAAMLRRLSELAPNADDEMEMAAMPPRFKASRR